MQASLENEDDEIGLKVVDAGSSLFPAFSHLLVAIVLGLVSNSNVNGKSQTPNDDRDRNSDHSWSYAHVVVQNSEDNDYQVWEDEGKTPHGIDVTVVSISTQLAE